MSAALKIYANEKGHILHLVENKEGIVGACLPERKGFLGKVGVVALRWR